MAGGATIFSSVFGQHRCWRDFIQSWAERKIKRSWDRNYPCALFVSFAISLDREPSVYNFSFFFYIQLLQLQEMLHHQQCNKSAAGFGNFILEPNGPVYAFFTQFESWVLCLVNVSWREFMLKQYPPDHVMDISYYLFRDHNSVRRAN